MTSSTTEGYDTGAFHSHPSLGHPYKGRKSKRICNSEPFIKPKMSLKQILDYLKNKCPLSPRDEKTVELLSITDNSTGTPQQKNKSELPPTKQRVESQKKSEKAGGLQIPKSDWDSLTRPSAKLILDPNTANPNLKLSLDGRSVRTKTHKEFHSSQSNEHQGKNKHLYDGWTCVQAQEGYTTGRHYWEVDVKGKCEWRIGVVKESAPRKGFINLNTAAGYWTLRLQLGSLMALTKPVIKLNQAPPSKIGVHLDLEGGQVSFYDAMKRKNIYTFKANFKKDEKIYPVFGTVETEKPLKII